MSTSRISPKARLPAVCITCHSPEEGENGAFPPGHVGTTGISADSAAQHIYAEICSGSWVTFCSKSPVYVIQWSQLLQLRKQFALFLHSSSRLMSWTWLDLLGCCVRILFSVKTGQGHDLGHLSPSACWDIQAGDAGQPSCITGSQIPMWGICSMECFWLMWFGILDSFLVGV